MKKNNLIFLLVSISIMIFFSVYNSNISLSKNKKIEIIGVINDIIYDSKKVPSIFVKGEKYYLARFNIRKRHGLQIGDSIFKKKNSKILELYSKSSKGYINTENFELKE
ncbi:hypothetical protein [Tenacibaculum halocynthiae]|uniref:hypothetical protein n=1 Tax=Tenacibaculum halocynthiae TaxID=1254437 RepID=UPI003D65449B